MGHLFYAPPQAIGPDGTVVLPPDETRHATRVLRRRPGHEIMVVDGAGSWYRVQLVDTARKHAVGTIIETRREVGEPPYDLAVGLALLKSRARFEIFLEKAVELGVRDVTPLVTRRTEATGLRSRRARQIMISAMKQCGRCRLPRLDRPRVLEEILGRGSPGLGLLCHPAASETAVDRLGGEHTHITILVGPEGGFTQEEVVRAQASGYAAVSLGTRRLRAETAAIAAMAVVMQVTARSVPGETPAAARS